MTEAKDERRGRYQTAERLICQLRDVVSSQIVADSEGNIRQIHVAALAHRNPKQIVRDIESLLIAELGLSVDHRKISIAQVGEKSQRPFITPGSRIQFSSVNTTVAGVVIEAEVSLLKDGIEISGTAAGPSSRTNSLRLVGQAALKAVSQLLPDGQLFDLSDVAVCKVGQREVVIAAIDSVTSSPREERSLAGCCLLEHDPQQAVVFATLDAINRYCGRLRMRPPIEDAEEAVMNNSQDLA